MFRVSRENRFCITPLKRCNSFNGFSHDARISDSPGNSEAIDPSLSIALHNGVILSYADEIFAIEFRMDWIFSARGFLLYGCENYTL